MVGIVIGAVGVALCFFGYRLFRFFLALIGFLVGGAIGAAIAGLFAGGDPGAAVFGFIAGGVIGAIANVAAYLFGVFMTGALIGAGLAVALPLLSGESPSLVLVLIAAVLGGIVALYIERLLIILSTSISGALVIVLGVAVLLTPPVRVRGLEAVLAEVFFRAEVLFGSLPAVFMLTLGLGVAGVIVQYRQTSSVLGTTVRQPSSEPSRRPREVPQRSAPRMPRLPETAAQSSVGIAAASSVGGGLGRPKEHEVRDVAESVLQARTDVEHVRLRAVEQAAADRSAATRAAHEAREERTREARERFRRGLETLRNEVLQAATEAGPGVAPWYAGPWRDLATVEPNDEAVIRLGDLYLAAPDDGSDMLSLPATIPLESTGAVVLSLGAERLQRAREAFIGWCVRLVAASGPGRVAVAWFDDSEPVENGSGAGPDDSRDDAMDTPDGVPSMWRRAEAVPDGWWSFYQSQIATRLLHDARRTEADESNALATRLVVVAVGAAVDAAPNLPQLIAANVANGIAKGVYLFVAPGPDARVDLGGHPAVMHFRGRAGGRQLELVGAQLGQAYLELDRAPPEELTRRVLAWSAEPPIAAPPSEQVVARHARPEAAEARRDAPTTGTAAAAKEPVARGAPRPSAARATETPDDTGHDVVADVAPDAAAAAARLDPLKHIEHALAAPATAHPAVSVGVDERGQLVRVHLAEGLVLRGGSVGEAAAVLARALIETACQSPVEQVEFAVADLRDDQAVADWFDELVDALPHFIDVSSGVAARVALDDVGQRIARGPGMGPRLSLFAIAPSGSDGTALALLTRILRDGPRAGVSTVAWLGEDTTDPWIEAGNGTVRIVLDGQDGVVQAAGTAPRRVRLLNPIASARLASISEGVRRVRS